MEEHAQLHQRPPENGLHVQHPSWPVASLGVSLGLFLVHPCRSRYDRPSARFFVRHCSDSGAELSGEEVGLETVVLHTSTDNETSKCGKRRRLGAFKKPQHLTNV